MKLDLRGSRGLFHIARLERVEWWMRSQELNDVGHGGHAQEYAGTTLNVVAFLRAEEVTSALLRVRGRESGRQAVL